MFLQPHCCACSNRVTGESVWARDSIAESTEFRAINGENGTSANDATGTISNGITGSAASTLVLGGNETGNEESYSSSYGTGSAINSYSYTGSSTSYFGEIFMFDLHH